MKKITLFLIVIVGFYSRAFSQNNVSFYIDKAIENSPLIKQSKNNIKIAELDLEQMKRQLQSPFINLESTFAFSPILANDGNTRRLELVSNGASNYVGYDLAVTDGGQYQAGVSLKQPLFRGAELQSFSNKAAISKAQNNNNIRLTKHQLAELVSRQYLVCVKSKMQIQNNTLLAKQLKEQIAILKKLVDGGIYRQTDLMLLQIAYSDYLLQAKQFQMEYASGLSDLNRICGIQDTGLVDIAMPDLRLNTKNSPSSAFMIAYKLDSLNFTADQKINENKYKPQLSWFANSGINATYLPTLNRFGFSTGLTFSWTLFDGHQKEMERQKTRLNINSLQTKKQNFRVQQALQKNNLLSKIKILEQNKEQLKRQVNQYQELINVYQKELSLGQVSIMDLKNILTDFANKKQALLLLELEQESLINTYNYWNY